MARGDDPGQLYFDCLFDHDPRLPAVLRFGGVQERRVANVEADLRHSRTEAVLWDRDDRGGNELCSHGLSRAARRPRDPGLPGVRAGVEHRDASGHHFCGRQRGLGQAARIFAAGGRGGGDGGSVGPERVAVPVDRRATGYRVRRRHLVAFSLLRRSTINIFIQGLRTAALLFFLAST